MTAIEVISTACLLVTTVIGVAQFVPDLSKALSEKKEMDEDK